MFNLLSSLLKFIFQERIMTKVKLSIDAVLLHHFGFHTHLSECIIPKFQTVTSYYMKEMGCNINSDPYVLEFLM